MVFEDDCRLFNCHRCHRQVRICRRCDYGNVYCSKDCSGLARSQFMRDAGSRYQKKPRGAGLHAARQKRLRKRQKENVIHPRSCAPASPRREKVTHHRFPIKARPAKVTTKVTGENRDEKPANQAPDVGRCDFCYRPVGPFARFGAVHRPQRGVRRSPRARWL